MEQFSRSSKVWTGLLLALSAASLALLGCQGPDGVPGEAGTQGPPGQHGEAGAMGPQGPAGAAGPAGTTGPQGPNGRTGAAGTDGRDVELVNLDGVLSWRYAGEDDADWRELASLATPLPPISLTKLGTYASSEGAEIVAFDPSTARAFVTAGATVEVLDLSDPSQPVLAHVIDASSDGDGVTSVDVKDGLVGVAVDADRGDDPNAPGKAVFYSATSFTRIAEAETGVLPDMITFTPDGKYALVANEGEPSDDYATDPAGSITVIDVDGGFTTATAAFDPSAFDLEALQQGGLRAFGPRAGLAEDVEPEYITVTPDSSTAYVALQENNAIAVVDIASATVTKILPLGYKDHSLPGNELTPATRTAASTSATGPCSACTSRTPSRPTWRRTARCTSSPRTKATPAITTATAKRNASRT